jgi:ADP-heptose:LPS heptosyltransferase
MKCIVVIRPGALGDVILTLPALHSLRRRNPDAHITVVGSPSLWELAGNLADARVSIDAARFSTLYADEPSPELRQWLAGTETVIAWTVHDPSHALRKAGVPTILHVSPYPPPGTHVANWLLRSVTPHPTVFSSPPGPPSSGILAQAGGGEGKADTTIRSSLSHRWEERGRGMRVLLHPGAGGVWKRWPAERFAAVGNRLRDTGYDVALVEGPADREAIGRCQAAAATPFPVLRDRSLPDLAAALADAALFIGNDSGVTHLAAAAGTPTIALFGPTDPATWAPLGPVRVLRHCDARATEPRQIRVCEGECLERITADEVLRAASDFLTVDNSVENHDDRALKDRR